MRFMVESSFKAPPTPDQLALIPSETAHGLKLDEQGLREHLFLAADNSRGWQILVAGSLQEAEAIANSFPLAPFLAMTITPLVDPQA